MADILLFCERASGIRLRSYQREVAKTIVDSVIHNLGLSIVVMFPRQSGKNELQAQVEAYLLARYASLGAEIVKVSPTWRPQSLNAMRRLEKVLERNSFTREQDWECESGYIFRLERARIYFLSGAPEANIVGATASTLLEVDEAQDVEIAKFDKDIAPMAASTNATRVFWGTAWTAQTLLGRELRAAQDAQDKDGRRRVFRLNCEQVAAEVPPYRDFVCQQVARLGRQNPMVKTQYFSEEIDAEGSMFPPSRLALIAAQASETCTHPQPGHSYALMLDVAGEDEAAQSAAAAERPFSSGLGLKNPGRDATAATLVEVDLSTLEDELIARPTYRVIQRRIWVGVRHTRLYAELRALAHLWAVHWLVVDATGVGAGLSSFLEKPFPNRLLPVLFTGKVKSDLGWGFLEMVDGGRFKDCSASPTDAAAMVLSRMFIEQLQNCQYEILPGPEKRMRWGVPDGKRSHLSGELLHDDLVVSAALAVILDQQSWNTGGPSLVVPRRDPLAEMDEEGW